jgi:hypothetical protein
MKYKQYLITEFVNDKGQWQAHIRRQDGKHMSVEGTTLPLFTTMHADTENEAIRIAKEAIDTRKISADRVELALNFRQIHRRRNRKMIATRANEVFIC